MTSILIFLLIFILACDESSDSSLSATPAKFQPFPSPLALGGGKEKYVFVISNWLKSSELKQTLCVTYENPFRQENEKLQFCPEKIDYFLPK